MWPASTGDSAFAQVVLQMEAAARRAWGRRARRSVAELAACHRLQMDVKFLARIVGTRKRLYQFTAVQGHIGDLFSRGAPKRRGNDRAGSERRSYRRYQGITELWSRSQLSRLSSSSAQNSTMSFVDSGLGRPMRSRIAFQ